MARKLLVPARGNAKKCGAVLVGEAPKLREISAPNEADTAKGREAANKRRRPFEKGNKAAANRGPMLARLGVNLHPTDEERGRVQRRADRLRQECVREMRLHRGGELSTRVRTEVASWALAIAWSRWAYEAGDAVTGSVLSERASAHLLKAEGLAARDAAANQTNKPSSTAKLAAKVRGGAA